MSEYWVSKKKYFCKYCEIYIADDAPSRQHHENGLKHKGNIERFIRGIYKAGEKKKKDQEEEKREMARVEQAPRAAFAQDVSFGHAKVGSAPVASSSSSSAPRKPATKPSNPFANYTTAAQLGIEDPDAEKLEIRKSQGLIGEWQLVDPTPAPPRAADEPPEEDTKPDLTPAPGATTSSEGASKRPPEASPEDDTRMFKLRKKTAALGEIYDPGVIAVKPRKKEEKSAVAAESSVAAASTLSSSASEVPKWTSISLKPKDSSSASMVPTSSSPIPQKEEDSDGSFKQEEGEKSQPTTSRWAKVQWGQPMREEEAVAAFSAQASQTDSMSDSTLNEPMVKTEEAPVPVKSELDGPGPLSKPEPSTAGLFKKRRAPNGAGRGRRQL
ncbi:WW domain-binding protein 4 [Leucoagaricus sp. SymC.cos]|nr:WW domain-binding protein 4 [Leucoagaricus sp. SymC.cos]